MLKKRLVAETWVKEIIHDFEKEKKSDKFKSTCPSALRKLKKLIEKINTAESKINKTLKTIKDGVAIAQRIAKHYNEIAQWLG